jgi:tetratricopeptide (TPR) repeat protein
MDDLSKRIKKIADGAKSNPNAVAEMLVLAEEFPNAPELWFDLAYIYSIQKDRASAADAVSRAIALDPDEPVYLFDRARYRASLGDYHGVIEDASCGIELSERIEFFTYKELLIFLRAYACVELREFCAAKDDLMSMERQDAVMWIHTLVTWEDLMARCDAGTSSETSSNG